MRVSILIGGLIVALLLLLAACAKEQKAVPLGTDAPVIPAETPAADAVEADSLAGTQRINASANVTVGKTKTETKTKAANATTPTAANATVASTTNATSSAPLVPGCLDTDYGKNYAVQGSVQYVEGGVSIIKSDDCIGGELREWYCDKGEIAKEIIICSKACIDGACID